MIDVPQVVRNKAVAYGASGWLDHIDDLATSLAAEWQLDIGRRMQGGTESVVVAVTCADGSPAVLKLLVPQPGEATRHEITALALARGEGCAQMLAHDLDRHALLLERLGRPMSDLDLPIGERHELLSAAASRMWRPAPRCGLPSGAEKGRWLLDSIVSWWHEIGEPCSAAVVEHAVACAERRIAAHDDERAVLVHGDVHQWNALEATCGFKLVDPDGLLAEPEYDLGIVMREDPAELMQGDPMDRALRLAALTGCDADAIWEWGVVERVSTGLWCLQIDLEPFGTQMLEAAASIANAAP